MSEMTGWAIMRSLNAQIKDLGYDRVLPGPQIYNYIKQGSVDGVKREFTSGVVIDEEVAQRWIEKYIKNNQHKWTRTVKQYATTGMVPEQLMN